MRMPSEAELSRVATVALRTKYGDIRIRLRIDWHKPSVQWVQRVALTDVCTIRCVFYRAEPHFLLQGGMRTVIAENKLTQTRPPGTPMARGHVAWAGGSSGPDLFITMHNTAGFGASHTVSSRCTCPSRVVCSLPHPQNNRGSCAPYSSYASVDGTGMASVVHAIARKRQVNTGPAAELP